MEACTARQLRFGISSSTTVTSAFAGRKRASEIGGRVSVLVDVDEARRGEARLANRRRKDDYVR